MAMLRDLQLAFRDVVFGAPIEPLAARLRPGGLPASLAFAVHRNTVVHGLIEALGDLYPAVRRIAGADVFAGLARAFIRRQPPEHGVLLRYGTGFADFIERDASMPKLPFLADLARLELAWHEAYHAADAPPLEAAALQGLAAERLPALRLALHPSGRLLRSRFPVDRIWAAHQPGADVSEAAAAGGANLLVIRPFQTVEIRSFAPPDYAFVEALSRGRTLVDAYETAGPEIDHQRLLADLLLGGTFCAWSERSE